MSDFQYYVPTKVYFGNGSLEKLATMDLPGKKAMICMTEGGEAVCGKNCRIVGTKWGVHCDF